MNGNLYLIPSVIADNSVEKAMPPFNQKIIHSIYHYIVENERTARRFLISLKIKTPIDNLKFYILNKHSRKEEIADFLKPVFSGNHIGLLSEAGLPCIADPGSIIVEMAHKKNIKVVPLIGPSSIMLALMASGLNGQSFTFNGYLPVNKNQKIKAIKYFEKKSSIENQTQIFIETPYRNNHLFEDIITTCLPGTMLCIACNLSSEDESISTKTIDEWKKTKPDLNKKPSIFLIQNFSKAK